MAGVRKIKILDTKEAKKKNEFKWIYNIYVYIVCSTHQCYLNSDIDLVILCINIYIIYKLNNVRRAIS